MCIFTYRTVSFEMRKLIIEEKVVVDDDDGDDNDDETSKKLSLIIPVEQVSVNLNAHGGNRANDIEQLLHELCV